MMNDRQKEIVTTKAEKVVVLSAAASGKTFTLIERAKYLLENKLVSPSKMVIITYTRAAAQEVKERLGAAGQGCFVGTIHGYANFILLSGGVDTSEAINEDDFDYFFQLIRDNPYVIKKVDYLLLDEAQDSTREQFEFILDMIKPKQYMFFGDHRQSIYEWNGATPDFLIDMTFQSGITTYKLTQNYRNGEKILNFAKRILGRKNRLYLDDSECNSGLVGEIVEMELNLPLICSMIKEKLPYREWFILCRTNSQVDTICVELQKRDIPFDSFKRSGMDNTELRKKMKNDTVKCLTVHTAKGLEADNVVVFGAHKNTLEEKRISYVAATRARKLLIWCSRAKKAAYKSWE